MIEGASIEVAAESAKDDSQETQKLVSPSYVFIVTYGRSGSTLLQKLLGSIDGYHVVGENYDALYGLYLGYESARLARRKYGKVPLPLGNPWHGADQIEPKRFGKAIVKAFVREVLRPPPTARVIGFKEVRYFEHASNFGSFLEFMLRFFHPAKLVFNVRSPESIASSAWWRELTFPEVKDLIDKYEVMIDEFLEARPDKCCKVSFDDYVQNPARLRDLFNFLGESFDEEHIAQTLSVKLDHGRGAKRPG